MFQIYKKMNIFPISKVEMIQSKNVRNKNTSESKNGYYYQNEKKYKQKWTLARRLLPDSRGFCCFYRNISSKAGLLLQKCLPTLSVWIFEALILSTNYPFPFSFIQNLPIASKSLLSNSQLQQCLKGQYFGVNEIHFRSNNSRFSV